MGISGLCVVHCIGTAVLRGLLASAGGFLGRPIIHEVGLTLAMIDRRLRAWAGVSGAWLHAARRRRRAGSRSDGRRPDLAGRRARACSIRLLGVLIVALGHRLNIMATRQRLLSFLSAAPTNAYLITCKPWRQHDHQLHEGDLLKEAARDRLTDEGEQWTDMRAAVFDALASFGKPASAYDIAEEVSKSQGRRVAANSVYRILDLFVTREPRPAGRKRQRLCREPASGLPARLHLPHLRYLRAGGAYRRRQSDQRCPRRRRKAPAFSAQRPVIEVRGTCGECAAGLDCNPTRTHLVTSRRRRA